MSASSWSFIAAGILLGLSILGICIAYFLGNLKFKDREPKN